MDDEISEPGSAIRRGDPAGSETQRRRARRSRIALWALAMLPALALSSGCSESAPPATADETQVFELSIEQRRVEVTDGAIRVRQGQRVKLSWLTDEATSIHLHGYDIRASLTPGSPVVWDFEANAAGRFPIEAHDFGHAEEPAETHDHSENHDHSAQLPVAAAEPAQTTLLYLEVYPH